VKPQTILSDRTSRIELLLL